MSYIEINSHFDTWYTMKILTLINLLCVVYSVYAEDDPLLVKVKQGSLIGIEITNEITNESYYGFYDIPFAQKPIGEKRFKDPEEPLPWDGVREASEVGNACVSMNPILQSVVGNEDCLNLNIYTPKPPSELKESPVPVMVWIHGGAFHVGSNTPLYYGPEFLITENIILVAINYRLNVFGFLSTQDEEVPGNAGLKDQVMALKWLKENINSFGGDPENITIFGESAGGASVHYLMISPSAKGLFQKAIVQSGTALSPWASTNLTLETTLKLGTVFDCKTDNIKELVSCLRKVDAYELAQYQYNTVSPKLSEDLKFNVFLPCVEPMDTPNPFINQDPRIMLEEGHFNDVPFIIGTVEMETIFLSKALAGDIVPEHLVKAFYSSVNKDPAIMLGARYSILGESNRKRVGEAIKKFFFQDMPVSESTLPNLINATSDLNFLLGSCEAVDYALAKGSSPIFQYHFTLETDYGKIKGLLDSTIKGPSHGDDMGYLFLSHLAPPEIDPESPGYQSMLKIVKLWTNFAKYGDPTPDTSLNVKWEPVKNSAHYYLDIGEELVLKQDVEKERMEFWRNLKVKEDIPDL